MTFSRLPPLLWRQFPCKNSHLCSARTTIAYHTRPWPSRAAELDTGVKGNQRFPDPSRTGQGDNIEPLHVLISDPRGRQQRPTVNGQSSRINGVLIDYASLVPLYGSTFVERLLDAFVVAYLKRSPSTAKLHYICIRRFLLFLAAVATTEQMACAKRIFDTIVAAGQPNERDFEEIFVLFISRLRDLTNTSLCSTVNVSTRTTIIDGTASALREMASQGLWPPIGAVSIPRLGQLKDGIPSLGELKLRFSSDVLSLSRPTFSSVMEANSVRLDALRYRLCGTFDQEWQTFKYGERLIESEPEVDIEDLVRTAARIPKSYGRAGYRPGSCPEAESAFPLLDGELTLGRLLKMLRHPAYSATIVSELPAGMQNLISFNGGIEVVGRYLQPNGLALVSAYATVLCDTGFNIQPCDDLPENPFFVTAKRGRQTLSTISSIKLRADSKIVLATLLEEDVPLRHHGGQPSSIEVINKWREMTRPIRARATGTTGEKLWIVAGGKGIAGTPTPYFNTSFSDWWYQLMARYADDPVIGGLPAARRNIRPTVVQLRASPADVGVAASALVGNHSSLRTVMRPYLGKGWFRSELDAKIRHYINLFEAALLSDAGAKSAGFDEKVFLARREDAVATGLGFACHDPLAGIQPGTEAGAPCIKLDACATCPMLRFVPSADSYRDLVVAHRSLLAAEPSFIAANPARWAQVWLPLRAMIEATIELLRGSYRKRAFEQVEMDVETAITNNSAVLLRVW